MTFLEIDKLHWAVIKFLWECGGIYRLSWGRLGQIQRNVILSIVAGKFLIHFDDIGAISLFVCYRMDDEFMFVLECGNKEGRQGMHQMISELRVKEPQTEGVRWLHKCGNKKNYPRQRGKKGA